ncbi:MAG: hypothetical protein R3E68_23180 [Burkholderiaceae bacterium]
MPQQLIDAPSRPDLSDRWLIRLTLALVVGIGSFLLFMPLLPGHWLRPGSAPLQSAAALGSLCLLVPFGFAAGKRAGTSRSPNKLFIAHVLASLLGIGLVSAHALAGFRGPPLVLLACLVLLLATGVVARVRISRMMAATLGSKVPPFAQASPALQAELRAIIARKVALLERLDPQASEAAVLGRLAALALGSPRQAFVYSWLVQRRGDAAGARRSVPFVRAWWRPLHLALAWLFLAGLLVHLIVVTFFAGYVTDGQIYWWHLAAWGR